MKKQKIFLAGGSEFIGSRTIRVLVNQGHAVIAVVKSKSMAEEVQRLGAVPVIGDPRCRGKWQRAIRGVDAVINLAFPEIAYRLTRKTARRESIEYLRISRNLAAPASRYGVPLFIQGNSVHFMPDGGEGWIDDDTPRTWLIRGFANLTAASARYLERRRARGFPLVQAIFPTLVYGPGGKFSERMVRWFMTRHAAILGRGDNWMSLIHVDDAAGALATLVNSRPVGERIIISDGRPVRQREFLQYLARKLGTRRPFRLPAWVLRPFLGTVLVEALTISSRAGNRKLQQLGYRLKYESYVDGVPTMLNAR